MPKALRTGTQEEADPLDCLSRFHNDIDYREFAPVSRQLLASYARVAELGMPASTVAGAMLGATLNFYELFGMTQELPTLLRAMADMLEFRRPVS
ncbi:hypothetical protein [Novosphingobium sp. BL-52-GroH]|uniref:hypothetical protein n=1 Tax=Novosphingobium sp. BL-52-GroH TaxID=3349877 RepID=UPI00384F31F0